MGSEGPFIADSHNRGLPALGKTAQFDGANSGLADATIVQVDLSVLDANSQIVSSITTDARTGFGDSGAALVLEDSILGFATTRSAQDSEVLCARWVWAKQVFDAHQIEYSSNSRPLDARFSRSVRSMWLPSQRSSLTANESTAGRNRIRRRLRGRGEPWHPGRRRRRQQESASGWPSHHPE